MSRFGVSDGDSAGAWFCSARCLTAWLCSHLRIGKYAGVCFNWEHDFFVQEENGDPNGIRTRFHIFADLHKNCATLRNTAA